MIGYAVFCIAEWDLGKWHCFTIGMEKDSSDLHVSVGETLVFSVREAVNCLKSNFSYNFGRAFFQSQTEKKKKKKTHSKHPWLRLFQIPTQEWEAAFCARFSNIQLTLWLSAETTQKGEVRGRGKGRGNGKLLSLMFKRLSQKRLQARVHRHSRRGNWLHVANDGSAHHWLCISQKKAILLSSNSIRIIYLLKDRKEWIEDQNHQPYLASSKIYGSCFQGQLDKKKKGWIHICTISCLSIFYKCYEQSQPLGTLLKLNNLYPSPVLEWEHISIIAIFNYSRLCRTFQD